MIPSGDSIAPKDRNRIVYLIMLLHGIGLLLPWNMFANAKTYFIEFKLHENYTGDPTPYAQYFMSYLGFAAQLSNISINWINIFINWKKITVRTRIICCICIQITIFSEQIILNRINTSGWPKPFLVLTVIGVMVINMANGVYQSSLFVFAAVLPAKFIGAICLGVSVNGVFVSMISFFSELFTPGLQTAGFFYFLIAVILLILCLTTIILLPINKFFRFHSNIKVYEASNDPIGPSKKEKIPYWYIIKKSYRMYVNIYLTLFVSLAIFPALHAFIKPSNPKFFIPERYFSSVTCFLTYNTITMVGSFVAPLVLWPKKRYIWIPVVLRLIMIPIFLFCNYHPPGVKRTLPVLVRSDWVYWFLSAFNGFLSGYLTSLIMMNVPGCVEENYASVATMFGSAFMETGAFTGVLFTFLNPSLVSFNFGSKDLQLINTMIDNFAISDYD